MFQLVTAVVKPHALEPVKEALQAAGIMGMTVTEVRGFGRQGSHTETYRGAEYKVDFLPKIRIDVVVETSHVQATIDSIAEAARTGSIGDGKIWTTNIGTIMRIRTGEVGGDAI